MPVDPAIQTLLDSLAGADPVDLSAMSVEQARQVIGMLALVDGDPEPVAEVSDHALPGPAGDVPVRIYRAEGTPDPAPVLVWYHGGGWVITWCSNTNNGKSYLNVGMNWTGTPQSGIDNGEYSWERMNILANGAGCSPWGGDAGPTVREEYGCEEDYSGSAT